MASDLGWRRKGPRCRNGGRTARSSGDAALAPIATTKGGCGRALRALNLRCVNDERTIFHSTNQPTGTPAGSASFSGPVALVQRLLRTSPPLAVLGVALAAMGVFFALGIWTDDRQLLGQPVWLKPVKFAASFSLYALTLTWLLGFVRSGSALVRRVVTGTGWVVAVTVALEVGLIALQAARGVRSHFNFATEFDQVIYSVMGVTIMVFFIANLLLAAILAFTRFESPVFGLAMRLGLVVTLVGMAEGFLMVSPTAQQLAGWEAGTPVTVVGAHTVGAPDGGPAMPLTGWSATAGDLRVAHFVGMHALQVLPLLGWLLQRRRELAEGRRKGLVGLASAAYLGVTLLLVWQALRAQPLLAPDALTLTASGLLAGATALGTLLLLRRPPGMPNVRATSSR